MSQRWVENYPSGFLEWTCIYHYHYPIIWFCHLQQCIWHEQLSISAALWKSICCRTYIFTSFTQTSFKKLHPSSHLYSAVYVLGPYTTAIGKKALFSFLYFGCFACVWLWNLFWRMCIFHWYKERETSVSKNGENGGMNS